jgi:arsenate reductase
VLFVCSLNAGRSQMAAAFFNSHADPTLATAMSAGLDPAPRVHPEVVTVMRELGIDLSNVVPMELTARMQTEVSFLVTLGCAETCPLIPEGRRADWKLADPAGQPLEHVRAIRDQIRALVEHLISVKKWGRP